MENKVVFLKGKKTILRPYDRERDLALMTRWVNDPDVTRFVTMWRPLTHSAEAESLDRLCNGDGNIFLVMETLEGQPIGSVGLHRIDWINRTATTGAMIGEKEFWGKGFGTDAKMQLLHFAFIRLNLRIIRSSVISYNIRSHKALLKQGYTEIGRLPGWFYRDGKYCDEIIFVLMKKRFMRMWRKYQEQ